jgi:NTP pyrophosphatase (non-canonical NTP hydrolase)
MHSQMQQVQRRQRKQPALHPLWVPRVPSRKEQQVKSTDYLIELVEQWAKDRQIVPNSTPMAQLMKTMSELGELADATLKSDSAGMVDGVGDVVVTLIIYCKLTGVTLPLCLAAAYEQIKDRKGTLTKEGVFVKEGDT